MFQKRFSIVTDSIKLAPVAIKKRIKKNAYNFVESTRVIFQVSQFFALMPLTGLYKRKKQSNEMKFQWRSVNTFYTVITIIGVLWMCVISVFSTVAKYGLKFGKICESTQIQQKKNNCQLIFHVNFQHHWYFTGSIQFCL